MSDTIKISNTTKVVFFAAAAVIAFCCYYSLSEKNPTTFLTMEKRAGGLGALKDKDDSIVEVVNKIKDSLEEKANVQYKTVEPLSYKVQVVAGKNYFVKAKTQSMDGLESIIHLKIYRNLKDELELISFDLNKTEEDELVYFP